MGEHRLVVGHKEPKDHCTKSKRLLGYSKTTHRFLNVPVQSTRVGSRATVHGHASVDDTWSQTGVSYTECSTQHSLAWVTDLGRALCVKNSGIFGRHG